MKKQVGKNHNLHNELRSRSLIMSRATMVDLPPEEDQETTDTLDNEANEIQQLDLNLDVEQPPQEEPTLPEKYQGKSLEQVVQMHQEAEKLLGRPVFRSRRAS